ncbi:gluconokinase [Sphingomonas sp.]|uniref:gluconokinase n=1 Tax=Sphingomonas sp. TaxID=28214 RepID=UPI003B3ABD7A
MPQAAISPAPAEPLVVVVMGVSGSGKSTLGALLAEKLDCPFLEGDSFHSPEAVAKMRSGHPLTDEDRWPWLDRLGAALGDEARAGGRVVAACSALRRVYRERLAAASGLAPHFVLLDNNPDEILRRLVDRPGHYMPPSLLESQLATLERPHADELALALRTDVPAEELRDNVLQWLETPPAAK